MKTKTVLHLFQHNDWRNLTWAQALEKFPKAVREVSPTAKPSWGSVWFVEGASGELKWFKDNFDTSN
jgi:hypothetical protein